MFVTIRAGRSCEGRRPVHRTGNNRFTEPDWFGAANSGIEKKLPTIDYARTTYATKRENVEDVWRRS